MHGKDQKSVQAIQTGATANRQLLIMVAAFASVYLVWGSTYLAIKYAIETMPPFLMAGSRFVIAGAILFLWARLSKDYEKPLPAHWRTTFVVGFLLLFCGVGLVVFAEHYIASSLAALLVATEPFWIVLLSWVWLRQGRPGIGVGFGLMLGFIGVVFLVTGQPGGLSLIENGEATRQMLGAFAVIAASALWAVGSIYGLRAPVPKSAVLTSAMQMLSGGAVLLLVSILLGEWKNFSIEAVSFNSWAGYLYLLIMGSFFGYTAYSWLLKHAQPSTVATYAYVNPVVAVVLGWTIAGEALTTQMIFGAILIVGSVALITYRGNKSQQTPDEISEEKSGRITIGQTVTDPELSL